MACRRRARRRRLRVVPCTSSRERGDSIDDARNLVVAQRDRRRQVATALPQLLGYRARDIAEACPGAVGTAGGSSGRRTCATRFHRLRATSRVRRGFDQTLPRPPPRTSSRRLPPSPAHMGCGYRRRPPSSRSYVRATRRFSRRMWSIFASCARPIAAWNPVMRKLWPACSWKNRGR